MLLGFDGYDMLGALGHINGRWTTVNSVTSVSLAPTGGRFGGQAIQFSNASTNTAYFKSALFTQVNVVGIGTAMNRPSNSGNTIAICGWFKGGTLQCWLRFNTSTGTIDVMRGSTVVGTSTNTIAPSQWGWLEAKATVRTGTNGIMEIKYAGAAFYTLSSVNLANAAADGCDQIAFGCVATTGAAGTNAFSFDDIIWWDTTGSGVTDFAGDQRVQTLRPNGAGSSTQFTPSTGSNYTCVNEVPPDTGTTYVSDSTVGHRDLYAHDDLVVGTQPPLAVQPVMIVQDSDAGVRTVRPVLKSGGTTDTSTAAFQPSTTLLAYTPKFFEKDPNTSAAWTATAVNNLEAGFEIVS